jgi:two-component system, OmpR family, phosphate regulon sensor histidine kinase PhoR
MIINLRWIKIFVMSLLISGVAVTGVIYPIARKIRQREISSVHDQLNQASLLLDYFSNGIPEQDHHQLDTLCRDIFSLTGIHITIIHPLGRIIADSVDISGIDPNIGRFPEIRDAIVKGLGTSIRFENDPKNDFYYLAVPQKNQGRLKYIVRLSKPLGTTGRIPIHDTPFFLLIGSIATLFFTFVTLLIFYQYKRKIRDMFQKIKEVARLDFGLNQDSIVKPDLVSIDQIVSEIARRLDDRLGEVTRQRNELNTILSSMLDAVLVVDQDERLVRFNSAAESLFHLDRANSIGLSIEEVSRSTSFHQFIRKTLSFDLSVEDEIVFRDTENRYFHAFGKTLKNRHNHVYGILIVLHEETQIKKSETIRRDFVANVSHELKTPLTAIKGFVEALLEDDSTDHDKVSRFLNIIQDRTNQMNALIDDLLSLARIENAKLKVNINMEMASVGMVVDAAAAACAAQAQEKGVEMVIDSTAKCKAEINPVLLEQAIVNLIDNAIKYSAAGRRIEIRCRQENKEILIEVQDFGCGIQETELPRIFERFYRVEKSRSRMQGGTGLGLAIVKHIVLHHHGKISVKSDFGKGTVFTIHLPSQEEFFQEN